MAIEHRSRWIVLLPAFLSGCFSASIGPDLARVERSSGFEGLADVSTYDVDPVTSDEVHALLRDELGPDDAVRVALANNREIRARLEELGIARGRVIQAGVAPNPTLEAEVLPERETRLELGIEYDLTSLVLAPLRARAARADLEAERFTVAGAVVRLAYDVRTAFYMLAAAEQRLAVGQRALDAFAAGRDAALSLEEAGNMTGLDVAAEVAAYERARLGVAELELEVADTRERLRRLLSLHGEDAEFAIDARLDSVEELEPEADIEARALDASLELASARQRVEATARRLGLARTEGLLPDISVDMHILRGRPEADPGVPSNSAVRFGGGVTVSVPLFDRRQGTRRALGAELDAGLERYYGLAIDIRSAARETVNRLASAHARTRHFASVVRPAQQRVLDETLLQYNAMQIDVFRLLQARRDRLEVELAYIDTIREYLAAKAALDALLAGQRVDATASARGFASASSSSSEGDH